MEGEGVTRFFVPAIPGAGGSIAAACPASAAPAGTMQCAIWSLAQTPRFAGDGSVRVACDFSVLALPSRAGAAEAHARAAMSRRQNPSGQRTASTPA
jgi:hypothetical protein